MKESIVYVLKAIAASADENGDVDESFKPLGTWLKKAGIPLDEAHTLVREQRCDLGAVTVVLIRLAADKE